MDAPRTSTRQRKVQDYSAMAKGLESEKATKKKSGIPVPLKKDYSAMAKGLDSEKTTKKKSVIPVPLKKRQFEKKQPSSVSASSTLSSSVASTSRVPTLTPDTNENSPGIDPSSVSTSSASMASTSGVPTQGGHSNATLGNNVVDLIQEAAANDDVSTVKLDFKELFGHPKKVP